MSHLREFFREFKHKLAKRHSHGESRELDAEVFMLAINKYHQLTSFGLDPLDEAHRKLSQEKIHDQENTSYEKGVVDFKDGEGPKSLYEYYLSLLGAELLIGKEHKGVTVCFELDLDDDDEDSDA